MSRDDLISVIMSVYDEESHWLVESVDSILNQTHKNIEFIIVVDNPENIRLIKILEAYENSDSRIKLLLNQKNKGLVYSLNRALEHCSGEYVARMDADDISHLDRLEKQLNFINLKKNDLVGANVRLFKGDKDIFFATDKLQTHKYLKKLLSKGAIGIVHPTFFARKAVFEKLKGYEYSQHTEDMEFLARVFVNGFTVGNLSEILLDCRYSDHSVTKSNAIYVDKMGRYVAKIFNHYLKTGDYLFDNKYSSRIKVSNKEVETYNRNQILLAKARGCINDKKYISFFMLIIKILSTSTSILRNIKVNLWLKAYRMMEKHCE